MLRRIVCHRWRRLWRRSFWRLFVRRLIWIFIWIFLVWIAIIVVVILAVAWVVLPRVNVGLLRFNPDGVQPRVAAIQLGLALVAHLAQSKLLLILQVAANIGVFAVIVPALVQFIILLPVQAVDLVIEIDFEFSTGIWHFGLARVQESRHSEQEGPDYKGTLVHTSLPGTFIWLLARPVYQF